MLKVRNMNCVLEYVTLYSTSNFWFVKNMFHCSNFLCVFLLSTSSIPRREEQRYLRRRSPRVDRQRESEFWCHQHHLQLQTTVRLPQRPSARLTFLLLKEWTDATIIAPSGMGECTGRWVRRNHIVPPTSTGLTTQQDTDSSYRWLPCSKRHCSWQAARAFHYQCRAYSTTSKFPVTRVRA